MGSEGAVLVENRRVEGVVAPTAPQPDPTAESGRSIAWGQPKDPLRMVVTFLQRQNRMAERQTRNPAQKFDRTLIPDFVLAIWTLNIHRSPILTGPVSPLGPYWV